MEIEVVVERMRRWGIHELYSTATYGTGAMVCM
jgi:hypothetical protein